MARLTRVQVSGVGPPQNPAKAGYLWRSCRWIPGQDLSRPALFGGIGTVQIALTSRRLRGGCGSTPKAAEPSSGSPPVALR